jgi:uridine kinase
MIIGIGGASTSGKSWLATKIKSRNPGKKVKLLCQDDFVLASSQLPHIRDHIDWEIPESINFDRYLEAVMRCYIGYDIVIAEGLMVFHDKRLVRLFDKKIFIEISKSTFMKRKVDDLRWGQEPDWYIEHIWESYLKYGRIKTDDPSYLIIKGDGIVDLERVYEFVGLYAGL